MSFFLSLSLSSFFRLTPWNTEALWVHFFAQASKTHSRRHSVSSPHREGAWGLREQNKSRLRGSIGFLCKPRNISLFLSSLFFLLYFLIVWPQTIRFQSIIRPVSSLSTTPSILRVPLDPAGAGPRQGRAEWSENYHKYCENISCIQFFSQPRPLLGGKYQESDWSTINHQVASKNGWTVLSG